MNNKVVLFGGSFDPPHLGHMVMARWTAELLQAPVRFLPTGTPPHKPQLSPAQARRDMLNLSIHGDKDFILDLSELESQGVNYTAHTLEHFRDKFNVGRDELYFVLGGDSIKALDSWRDPARLGQLCTLVMFQRDQVESKVIDRLKNQYGINIVICPAPQMEISSTLIRQRVRDDKSIKFLVPDPVAQYIFENGLYKEG